MLKEFSQLKVLVSNTTSIPHIDSKFAEKMDIKICALHDEPDFLDSITPTAEHSIGLLLSVWRKIPFSHLDVCSGNWNRRNWGAPKMLSKMTLGIVGFGRLGSKVAKIAIAMGMKVNFYDPFVDGSVKSLKQLAFKSNVLSIHAASTPTNKGLVSKDILEALPEGAVVINTARGELLDTNALLKLLKSGHLAAAALDTLDGEYFPNFTNKLREHPLIDYAKNHQNLLITPHIGGSTIDAWTATEKFVIEKAAKALNLI